ncbi:hypothetical protein ARNL5_00080, partial [Anaerolineae bacterium]
SYIGLFGSLNSATITNLGLIDVYINGLNGVGSLTGWETGAGGVIQNVYATGSVSGDWQVGGLAGLSKSSINQSYAAVNVAGKHDDLGGLVGQNKGNINNAYATGNVTSTGTNSVMGGLIGANYAGNVEHTYASGLVSGTGQVGGLVGVVFGGSISNSFWDTQTTNQSVGIAFNGGTVSNVVGDTTSNLMTQSTYSSAGWDFTNTWWMSDTNTRPYLRMEYNTNIANTHQLQLMAMDLDANYKLVNNLDFSSDFNAPSTMWSAKGFVPIGSDTAVFTGTFDGLNHTINTLFLNRPTTDYVALFGYIDNGSTIDNVMLSNIDITGQSYVGGLVGFSQSQTSTTGNSISNAMVSGTVTGTDSFIGGLIGYSYSAINNSYADVKVTGVDNVGGLVGEHQGIIQGSGANGDVIATGINGKAGGLVGSTNHSSVSYASPITKSYANGNVTADIAGGLVGYNTQTDIKESYAIGNVAATVYGGGLVGQQFQATVSDSYATGDVSGTGLLGGLVGLNDAAFIDNAYAIGTVSGTGSLGGLVGTNSNGSNINNSFWNIDTTGQSSIGINDTASTITNSVGKTTADMKKIATFSSAG